MRDLREEWYGSSAVLTELSLSITRYWLKIGQYPKRLELAGSEWSAFCRAIVEQRIDLPKGDGSESFQGIPVFRLAPRFQAAAVG
jgi:hypothetical protein